MPHDVSLSVLIFDVDGTLAETEEYHRRAFNMAFRKAGLDWNWEHKVYLELLGVTGGIERIRHYAAQNDTDFLSGKNAENCIAMIHRMKTDYYGELVQTGEVVLRPGIERLINEAKDRGLRLAISTTTTRANVLNLLRATLGGTGVGYFDAISAGCSAR